jgi:DNA-binding Xre family transcriptional regulator
MSLSDAIRKRIKYYLDKNDMSIWALFKATGIPRSTLCAFMNGTTELIKLDTLLHVCEGFNITLIDFFNDPIFKEVEQD